MTKRQRKESAVRASPASDTKEAGNFEIALGVLAQAGRLRRDIAPLLRKQERDRALGFADQLKALAEGLQTTEEGSASVAYRMRIAAVLMQVEVFNGTLASSLPVRPEFETVEAESKDAA